MVVKIDGAKEVKKESSCIAAIYKDRWQIEIFFKDLKQNLKIKTFVGTSPNAVEIQIWTPLFFLSIAPDPMTIPIILAKESLLKYFLNTASRRTIIPPKGGGKLRIKGPYRSILEIFK